MSNVSIQALPKELIINSEVLLELRKPKPLLIFLQSIFNLSAYIALSLIGVWIDTLWIWPIIWWFQGFILSCFLGASHDCAHGVFGKSSRNNHLAGVFWSSIVLFNFTIYKYYHLEHHKYTTIPGDTEPSGVFRSFWDYLYTLPMLNFFTSFWIMSWHCLFGKFPHFVRTEQARRSVLLDNIALFLWVFLIILATSFWIKQSLCFYWGPMIFFFPMVFFTSFPEHYGCEEGFDPLCNTRTLSSNFLFRYMFWNGNYHAEHHVYPSIPSHNLPIIHQIIGKSFKFYESSYILFHLKLIRGLLTKTNLDKQQTLNPLKRVDYEIYNSSESITSSEATTK
jgi:fatty acid desaturase